MTKDVRVFTYETRIASDPLTQEVLCAFGKLYGEMERSLFKELTSKTPHHINEIKSHFLNCFGVTARQFNGCQKLLQGKIESVKECALLRIADIKERIKHLKQKIPRIKKADVRHEKKRSLQKTIDLLHKLEKDQKEGVISLCFGGKKLFHAQFNLKENEYDSFDEWKKDWQEVRSSEFYCIGSKDETAGNQTCVLTLSPEGAGNLHLRLPDFLMEQFGKHLVIPITFPVHGRQEIYKALQSKQALSYRFKKDEKGWRVFVSFERERAPTIAKNHTGSIGIDINVNHIALVETNIHGNLIAKKSFSLCTYGKSQTQA
ncbi:helix-loop-helix domain-containing protein, partial [Candidatus Woesearchaeota archaeon]|nr:helix-loop-helix domain-containing protein [Candidatus Woesearchaeota archaeon]